MSSNWWDDIEVYESDYVPGSFTPGDSVEANHNLLEGLRVRDFDTADQDYNLGLLTLLLVFVFCGVLAAIVLPLLFCLCLGGSKQARLQERLKSAPQRHCGANVLTVLASLAAVAAASGAIWGLQRSGSGLVSIEDSTEDVASDLMTVFNLPGQTSVALGQLSDAFQALEDSADECDGTGTLSSILEALDFPSLVDSVQEEVDNINDESLDELAREVEGVSNDVHDAKIVRRVIVWPSLVVSFLFIIFFVLTAIGAYECLASGRTGCRGMRCCITPCAIFFAVVIWVCTALTVTLSALTGDFCIDPDASTSTLVSSNVNDTSLDELVTYYTTDCSTKNEVVETITLAQHIAVASIQIILPTVYQLTEDLCEDLEGFATGLDVSFRNLWTILETAAELSSCENVNGVYESVVYEELCDDIPEGMLGYWVSCVFLTGLLVMLTFLWERRIKQEETELDAFKARAVQERDGIKDTGSPRAGDIAGDIPAPVHH